VALLSGLRALRPRARTTLSRLAEAAHALVSNSLLSDSFTHSGHHGAGSEPRQLS
jgi:hypothetical protein